MVKCLFMKWHCSWWENNDGSLDDWAKEMKEAGIADQPLFFEARQWWQNAAMGTTVPHPAATVSMTLSLCASLFSYIKREAKLVSIRASKLCSAGGTIAKVTLCAPRASGWAIVTSQLAGRRRQAWVRGHSSAGKVNDSVCEILCVLWQLISGQEVAGRS